MHATIFLLALATIGAGCGDTGQRDLKYKAYFSGRATAPFAVGEWEVALDVASVGFGPAYFCASASSSLCPAAMAEFAASVAVNGLEPVPQQIGSIDGVSGQIRSATYDYALTWFTTQASARPTAAAPGGHSAHFEGRAQRAGLSFRFVADVDVAPRDQGTQAVRGVYALADVQDEQVRLDVQLDPAAWWRAVNFDEVAGLGGDPVVVPASSPAHNAIALEMQNRPATFSWSEL